MYLTKRLWDLARKGVSRWFSLDGTGYAPSGIFSGRPALGYIGEEQALTSSTFFACVQLIGGTISTLGFDVYREKKSGGADVASAHPLHQLLKWEPNEHQTSAEFWQQQIFRQEICGNAYARVLRTNIGGVISLDSWDPERVRLNTDKEPWVYEYQPSKGGKQEYPEWRTGRTANVLHLRNTSMDGVYGLSTARLASQRLGLDLAVEKYGATFFARGGRVKDIFEFAQVLSTEQRVKFKERWAEDSNPDNFHNAFLAEAGTKYVGKSGATPNEAQFLETQVANAIALCRFMGIPPTLVGILDRATYNNQEQLMLQFLQLGLTTRVVRIEQTLRRSLLTEEEKRSGYYIHSKVQKVLRGDTKARADFYKTLVTLGALSQNEIRDLEDMPRIDDPAADEYRQAQNLFGPADTADTTPDGGGVEEIRRTAA